MSSIVRIFQRFIVVMLAAGGVSLPSLAQAADTIGTGDSVRVTVFQYPDLTTETRVGDGGVITFPMIGEVKLDGLTPAQAGSRIAERLKKGKFLVDPQVSVSVLTLRSRQASVLGQVARPGRYALDDGNARLTDLIALAGGITPAGDDKVTVVMNRNGKSVKREVDISALMRGADMSGNVELANGDTVFVPRAGVFYVYGEVARSGAYRVEPNLSVRQAITLGGGLTPRGTEKGLTIHRTRDGKTVQMEVKPTDHVQADDIIFVKESFF